MQQLIDQYFHQEELEVRVAEEEEECMSTDTEATETVRRLILQCLESTESLQVAVCETLTPATAPRPAQEEYYYDSDDSVVDLDEKYPDLAERIVQWQATQKGTVSAPPWRPPNFGQQERATLSRLPDLREDVGPSQGHLSGRPSPRTFSSSHATVLHQCMGPGSPMPVTP